MKKLFVILIEPFKGFGSRIMAEKIAIFFSRHQALVYVLAVLITFAILFIFYALPYILG